MADQPEYLTQTYWTKRTCPAADNYGTHWFREGDARCTRCDCTPTMLARQSGRAV